MIQFVMLKIFKTNPINKPFFPNGWRLSGNKAVSQVQHYQGHGNGLPSYWLERNLSVTHIVHYLHFLLTAAVVDVSLLGSNGLKCWKAKHESVETTSHGGNRMVLLDHNFRPADSGRMSIWILSSDPTGQTLSLPLNLRLVEGTCNNLK